MLYMMEWKIKDGCAEKAVNKFDKKLDGIVNAFLNIFGSICRSFVDRFSN